MIYPEIQFAVLKGRPTVNRHLRRFGQSVAHYREFIGSATWKGTFAVRNEIFRWFITETDLPWLVMLDDDIVLTVESEPFILGEADVTGPHVVDARGREAHPTGLASGAIKFSRRAVGRLDQCWAAPVDGTCGCNMLYNECRKAGLGVAKAGTVGHRVPVTVFPGPAFVTDEKLEAGMSRHGNIPDLPTSRCDLDAYDGQRTQGAKDDGGKSGVADVCDDLHAPIIGDPGEKDKE